MSNIGNHTDRERTNRRTFVRRALGLATGGVFGLSRDASAWTERSPARVGKQGIPGIRSANGHPHPAGTISDQRQTLRVNSERVNRILTVLQRFGGTGDGGTERLAFSDNDIDARNYLSDLMMNGGLSVSNDLAGNLIGRREGTRPEALPIVIGSHIDSVPQGGSYDGQVGSAGAVEVALSLADAGLHLTHPLEIILFVNEEGGKTGSRALVGRVMPFELDIETASGFTIGEGIARLGGDPTRLADAQRNPGSIHGFLELHIEQGAELHRKGLDIGVVQGIVGIRRWNIVVKGFANHAGTTPMDQRRDALVAAADLVTGVHDVTRSMDGTQVATVGRIEAVPGAPNVVPGEARATLEIRDLSMDTIDRLFRQIEEMAETISRDRSVDIEFDQFYESLAAPTAPAFQDLVASASADLGLTHQRMPSGAGHDAQSMAELGPVGMIFVPSREGISHSPLEHTTPEDVVNGTNVLLQTLLALDQT